MQRVVFDNCIDGIYAAFGKNEPSARISDAIFRRVENLPDEFMLWAEDRLADEERLPANLGAYLKNILWPDFKQAHPEKIVNIPKERCNRCGPTPGIKRFYGKDWEVFECACDCCKNEWLIQRLGYWTDRELWDMGFSLALPDTAWNNERTQKYIKRVLDADLDAVRPAHKAYTERYVEQD